MMVTFFILRGLFKVPIAVSFRVLLELGLEPGYVEPQVQEIEIAFDERISK